MGLGGGDCIARAGSIRDPGFALSVRQPSTSSLATPNQGVPYHTPVIQILGQGGGGERWRVVTKPPSPKSPLTGSGGESTFLLVYFWAFLGGLERGEGAPLVRYLCKTHRSLRGRHV